MDKISPDDLNVFLKTGALPQYKHIRGYEDGMPIVRKLLGVNPDGKMPNNFIGRTMQRIIDQNSKEGVR